MYTKLMDAKNMLEQSAQIMHTPNAPAVLQIYANYDTNSAEAISYTHNKNCKIQDETDTV